MRRAQKHLVTRFTKGKNKKNVVTLYDSGKIFHILEQFEHGEVEEFQKAYSAFNECRNAIYQALSSQRQQIKDDILNAIIECSSKSLPVEKWIRVIEYQYGLTPLSVLGSKLSECGGRFNFPNDPENFTSKGALYIAHDQPTAISEKYGTVKSVEQNVLNPLEYALLNPESITQLVVNGYLSRYFDLTDYKNLRKINSILCQVKIPREVRELEKKNKIPQATILDTAQKLHQSLLDPDWRSLFFMHDLPANSQIFGEWVSAAGIQGILYPSVRRTPIGKCIAMFPHNFSVSDAYIEVAGKAPEGARLFRLDKTSGTFE